MLASAIISATLGGLSRLELTLRSLPGKFVPAVTHVLDLLGWWVTPDHGFIQRRDSHGVLRTFEIGVDNETVIQQWVYSYLRRQEAITCGRIKKDRHRYDDVQNLASGLNLQRPEQWWHCLFAGHKKQWKKADSEWMRHAAKAFAGLRLTADDARAQCMCGQVLPSRPHLMWACEATASFHQGLLAPVDRVEERLFAKPLPEFPSPPIVVDPGGLVNEMADLLDQIPLISDHCFVATDGAMKHDVACFAVVCPGTDRAISAGVAGRTKVVSELRLKPSVWCFVVPFCPFKVSFVLALWSLLAIAKLPLMWRREPAGKFLFWLHHFID